MGGSIVTLDVGRKHRHASVKRSPRSNASRRASRRMAAAGKKTQATQGRDSGEAGARSARSATSSAPTGDDREEQGDGRPARASSSRRCSSSGSCRNSSWIRASRRRRSCSTSSGTMDGDSRQHRFTARRGRASSRRRRIDSSKRMQAGRGGAGAAGAGMVSAQAGLKSTTEVKSIEAGRGRRGHQVGRRQGERRRAADPDRAAKRPGRSQADQLCGGDVHALVYVPAASAGKVQEGAVRARLAARTSRKRSTASSSARWSGWPATRHRPRT